MKQHIISAGVERDTKALVRSAASKRGVSVSTFLRRLARREAAKILVGQEVAERKPEENAA